jgi:hypothetical protein
MIKWTSPLSVTSHCLSHVPSKYLAGSCDVVFDRDQMLNTDDLASFAATECLSASRKRQTRWTHEWSGVRTLQINERVNVTVTGSVALVISGGVTINGTLDGSAVLETPGPGGARSGRGMGKGGGWRARRRIC